MKRIFKRVTVMLILVCMAAAVMGCGKGKKQTATCTIEQNGANVQMVLDAEGDKIVKLTQTSTLPIAGMTPEMLQALDQQIEVAKGNFSGIDGVTYKSEKTDAEVKEVIVIDANKDTLKEVSDKGLLPIKGNTSNLSLKATTKSLEDAGWTVK